MYISYGLVSVCLRVSVTRRYCIEPVAWLELVRHTGLSRLVLHCVLRKLRYLQK